MREGHADGAPRPTRGTRDDAASAEEDKKCRTDEFSDRRAELMGIHAVPPEGEKAQPIYRVPASGRNTSAALIPPNPNEFETTAAGAAVLPLPGRQSRSQLGSGRSRLIVGGSQRRDNASAQIAASIAPLAPRAWP